MHQLIGLMVSKKEAKTKEEALEKAEDDFNRRLLNRSFDYVVPQNDGFNRWQKTYPEIAYDLAEDTGTKIFSELWGYTKKNKEESLDECRIILMKSNSEILKGKPLDTYPFYEVGRYDGMGVHLYDMDTMGISNQYWFDECYKDKKDYWLVLFDAHN